MMAWYSRLRNAARASFEIRSRRGWRYFEYIVDGVAIPAAVSELVQHVSSHSLPKWLFDVASRGEQLRRQSWWSTSSPAAQRNQSTETRHVVRQYSDAGPYLNAKHNLLRLSEMPAIPTIHAADDQDLRLVLELPRDCVEWGQCNGKREEALSDALDQVHRHGITDLTFDRSDVFWDPVGNSVFLTGFDRATQTSELCSFELWLRRDSDRCRANAELNAQLMTLKQARALCREARQLVGFWYAPVDLGHGLTIGSFWGTNAGTGRWEYFNGPRVAPIVCGKRVVDLGSNNGLGPLMMLRAGASSVLGFELDDSYYQSSIALRQLFEWADMRRYAVEIQRANMLDFCTASVECDVVTAFCSLYYLDEDQIAYVIRCAARRAPTMIIQGNEAKRSDRANQQRRNRATVAYLKDALQSNGYPEVETYSVPGFSRPLLVGRR